jgi:hypothetical protein
MRWSIERFERDLLSGPIDSIAVPSNEILESLDRVEDVLGSEWIKSKGSAKGLGPAMHIFGTGLRLASLEHLDNTHELIRKLQLNDPSADTELAAIHLLRSTIALSALNFTHQSDRRSRIFGCVGPPRNGQLLR